MRLCSSREIPKELLVNGETWKIIFKRKIDEDRDTLGLADSGAQTIYIKMGQSKEETLKTLIHELLHAIEYEYDVDIEHSIIEFLEEGIFDFIEQNL